MRSEEGRIDVPGGRVWYRSLGENGTPLLCLHGGRAFRTIIWRRWRR